MELGLLIALKYGGSRGFFARKVRKSMDKTVLYDFEHDVLPPQWRPTGAISGRDKYVFPNGSEIEVFGLDNPYNIMSSEFDWGVVFEGTQLTVDDYELLVTRMSGKHPDVRKRLIIDCNPSDPEHFLWKRVLSGEIEGIASDHRDNPRWYNEATGQWTDEGLAYIASLDALTGFRKARLRHGKWVGAEGMVYDAFDASVHVLDEMPKGWQAWRKLRSIDFGFTNPFVCQWWAIDPDGRMYLYREIYRANRIVSKHAEAILAAELDPETNMREGIELTVADHDAEDRATLWDSGIGSITADKRVGVGIEEVKKRLALAGDGRPRLYIYRHARIDEDRDLIERKVPTSTLGEIGGYVWSEIKADKEAKEEPVKLNDHGMDAMRYAVMASEEVDHAAPPAQPIPAKNTLGWILRHPGQFGDEVEEDEGRAGTFV